jgi:hypothetical protein
MHMPNKTPAVISAVLTFVLLIVLAILSVLLEMLALNGASESQGMTAMGTSILCQGVGALVLAFVSWRLTNLLITKFEWKAFVAVIAAVFAGLLLGTGLSFLSIIISIPLAGIR